MFTDIYEVHTIPQHFPNLKNDNTFTVALRDPLIEHQQNKEHKNCRLRGKIRMCHFEML